MASNDAGTYFEDIEVGRTEEFGEYKVTKEEIVEFGRRYDPQPFHVDEAAAADTMFGGLVASGWHTAAMTMKLLIENQDDDTASAGGRGADDLRWHQPVRPGDVLSVRVETVDKEPASDLPGIGYVDHDVTGLNEDGEPVITWTALAMVEQRDGQ